MALPVQDNGFPMGGSILSRRRHRSSNGRLQALNERVPHNDIALLVRSFRRSALPKALAPVAPAPPPAPSTEALH